jgi:hypothetical protein
VILGERSASPHHAAAAPPGTTRQDCALNYCEVSLSPQPSLPTQSHIPVEAPAPPEGNGESTPKRSNGIGVAALVVGIIGAILGIIPFIGDLALILGPVAIGLGIVGTLQKSRKRRAAVAGLILGVVAMILAVFVSTALASGARSATNGPAPTVPPAVESSAMATNNPDATKSERGHVIRVLGQGAGISDKSGKQAASFVVNNITIDPVCTGKDPVAPENGHFLALEISAQTYPPLKDVFGHSGTFPFRGGSNWKLIAANGTTYNGDLESSPARDCLADAEIFPYSLGPAEKATGKIVLDVPTTEGTLVFDPFFEDAGWEWQYPAK